MIVSKMHALKFSIAEFKAWSQSLGHERTMTTLASCRKIGLEEQGRLVRWAGEGNIRRESVDAVGHRGSVAVERTVVRPGNRLLWTRGG